MISLTFKARVVPIWSPEFAFLFQPAANSQEQLRAHGIESVVLGSDASGSDFIGRQPWARLIQQSCPQDPAGYYRLEPNSP